MKSLFYNLVWQLLHLKRIWWEAYAIQQVWIYKLKKYINWDGHVQNRIVMFQDERLQNIGSKNTTRSRTTAFNLTNTFLLRLPIF